MTEIYLIRHAQAEGNLYQMMQGYWDGNVTALGTRQIAALAERFRDVKLDALYSSDLRRTILTAGAITKYHALPINTDKRLREIDVGPWETAFFGNLIQEDPARFNAFIADQENYYLEGGETYEQVRQRAVAAVNDIVAQNEGKTIAIVSHGITIRCILSRLCGISLGDTQTLPIFKNTGIAHLFHDGENYSVDYLNDASHLTQDLFPRAAAPSLRHVNFDPAAERAFYTACYADAWQFAHGSLTGYNENIYFDSARIHYEEDNKALFRLLLGDEDVGMLDLDTRRGQHAGYGWISLLYLRPEYRGKGFGIQVLGRAVQKYKAMGRKAIRLHVAEENTAAVAFYERWGFEKLSFEYGASSRLWLMEKKI